MAGRETHTSFPNVSRLKARSPGLFPRDRRPESFHAYVLEDRGRAAKTIVDTYDEYVEVCELMGWRPYGMDAFWKRYEEAGGMVLHDGRNHASHSQLNNNRQHEQRLATVAQHSPTVDVTSEDEATTVANRCKDGSKSGLMDIIRNNSPSLTWPFRGENPSHHASAEDAAAERIEIYLAERGGSVDSQDDIVSAGLGDKSVVSRSVALLQARGVVTKTTVGRRNVIALVSKKHNLKVVNGAGGDRD